MNDFQIIPFHEFVYKFWNKTTISLLTFLFLHIRMIFSTETNKNTIIYLPAAFIVFVLRLLMERNSLRVICQPLTSRISIHILFKKHFLLKKNSNLLQTYF